METKGYCDPVCEVHGRCDVNDTCVCENGLGTRTCNKRTCVTFPVKMVVRACLKVLTNVSVTMDGKESTVTNRTATKWF